MSRNRRANFTCISSEGNANNLICCQTCNASRTIRTVENKSKAIIWSRQISGNINARSANDNTSIVRNINFSRFACCNTYSFRNTISAVGATTTASIASNNRQCNASTMPSIPNQILFPVIFLYFVLCI